MDQDWPGFARRGWEDFKSSFLSFGPAVFVMLIGVGLTWASDRIGGPEAEALLFFAVIGVLFTVLLVWSLARAPFKQRDEARSMVDQDREIPRRIVSTLREVRISAADSEYDAAEILEVMAEDLAHGAELYRLSSWFFKAIDQGCFGERPVVPHKQRWHLALHPILAALRVNGVINIEPLTATEDSFQGRTRTRKYNHYTLNELGIRVVRHMRSTEGSGRGPTC